MRFHFIVVIATLALPTLAQPLEAGRDYQVTAATIPAIHGSSFGTPSARTPAFTHDVGGWALEGQGFEARCDDVADSCTTTMLRSRSGTAGHSAMLHHESALPWRGLTVAMHADFRVGRLDGTAQLVIRVEDAAGRELQRVVSPAVRGTTGFRWQAVSLTVPEGAERLTFGLEVQGTGAVFLRGVRFDEAALLGQLPQ